MLRYQENNELHPDFHGTTNTTLDYIAAHYGVDVLKKILRKTGHDVYRSIRENLQKGDAGELVEHLNWFFFRESAPYQLTVTDGEIRFEVFECPAHRHLRKLGMKISPHSLSSDGGGQCGHVRGDALAQFCGAYRTWTLCPDFQAGGH